MNKIILIVLLVTNSFSFVAGGSNLDYFGYPQHNCKKPYKPYEFRDQWELDDYKYSYNRYIKCINEYIENGNNDIQRIQEDIFKPYEKFILLFCVIETINLRS